MFRPVKESFRAFVTRENARVEEGAFRRSHDGGLARYALIVPARFRGGILFSVHGTGNDGLFPHAYFFDSVLAAGHAVFHFDLDGHGAASTTVFSPADVDQAVGEAHAALRAAMARMGGDVAEARVVGMGHSLGGVLLAKALAAGAARMDAVALVSTPARLRIGARAVLGEALTPVDWLFWGKVWRHGPREVLPAFGRFRRDEFPFRLAPGWEGRNYVDVVVSYINGAGLAEAVPLLPMPTLWVSGAWDGIAPAADAARLAALQRDGWHVSLRGRNHFTTLLHPRVPALLIELLGSRPITSEPSCGIPQDARLSAAPR